MTRGEMLARMSGAELLDWVAEYEIRRDERRAQELDAKSKATLQRLHGQR